MKRGLTGLSDETLLRDLYISKQFDDDAAYRSYGEEARRRGIPEAEILIKSLGPKWSGALDPMLKARRERRRGRGD